MLDDKPSNAEQRASAILLPGVVLEKENSFGGLPRHPVPDPLIETLQRRLGVFPDGIVGPATLKAAGGDILVVTNLTTSRIVLSSRFMIMPAGTLLVGADELEYNQWIRDFVHRGMLRVQSVYKQPAYDLVFTDED